MPNAKYVIHVQIDEAFSGDVAAKLLRDAARAALKHEQAAAGSLSIALAASRLPAAKLVLTSFNKSADKVFVRS